jgi:cytochrome oxidase assembly protein ShyY1
MPDESERIIPLRQQGDDMRRGRVLLAIILGVLGFALTLSLGNWQSRRAQYKLVLQAQWDSAQHATPIPVTGSTLGDVVARVPVQISLTGRFRHDRSVWLDNRTNNGRAGFFVLTPLEIDAGGVVLVNRGWVARDALDRLRLPDISEPAGPVSIEGLALAQLPRLLELGAVIESGAWPRVWQNVDLDAFEHASGLKVARFVVQQTSRTDDTLVRDWPAPDLGIEKNRGYALQWYSLAALITVATLFFGWRAWRSPN